MTSAELTHFLGREPYERKVVIGATETGARLLLGLEIGDKESASNWREFFKDLKRRGLGADKIMLGIMNGLPGLGEVFKEEFPKAKVQRCLLVGKL